MAVPAAGVCCTTRGDHRALMTGAVRAQQMYQEEEATTSAVAAAEATSGGASKSSAAHEGGVASAAVLDDVKGGERCAALPLFHKPATKGVQRSKK